MYENKSRRISRLGDDVDATEPETKGLRTCHNINKNNSGVL